MIAVLLLAQLSTAVPVEHHEWWNHGIIFASGVAAAADLSSTSWARGKNPDRFIEANPALRWAADDPVTLAVVKASVDGAMIWYAIRQHERHPKLVFVVMAVKTAASAYVAHRNAKTIGLR